MEAESKTVYQPLPVDRGEVPQFSFLMELLGQIKSKLVPSRKEDPSVRVQIPFDKGLFHSTLAVSGTRVQHGGEEIFNAIDSQNVLNEYLSKNWHFVSMCMGIPLYCPGYCLFFYTCLHRARRPLRFFI